ncbi:ATP-dependent Clp protease proteolytic subunit [Candidatus Dojkabacteria bacterium CG_4_9_14_3_um_filter_150_Dojkabacteria_WS6_41_13]|uniref:ATP-dependent Clp protease proteolytic subunit n=1 Tax=Candidatus Dojkabacteria bacterium CG_4_10_14_0_2_um_filter_Dojkabacteria_WS6_41_15 TaxID=2014249 RepID=A0A2M7W135_9BACT|nr:MAG: ATP-dependent Clp protease proteolytic subunit [Candidatus Dojkabacteria bacterium CG_4_10_14_0_2_um_filter_Dojkabacteria_WS6_41_15]PJB22904.1 MAG: ATP-dependent Clp protease proteolytic subunit [Candidatus Dojkabacteria bacterium CG_4_9_14_3_um_filter_150_Dojkabacteria_WS6_41_13]
MKGVTANIIIPTVFEEDRRGNRSYYDIFSRLLKDRIIFLNGPVTDQMANIIIAEMVFLEKENTKEDIQLYIQSPGGSVAAGLAIYDAMQYLKPNIVTIGMGMIASMASLLITAGAKGKRFMLPHARLMIHQVHLTGLPRMTATELMIENDEMQKNKQLLNTLLAKHTGKTVKEITNDTELDNWMSAEEAVKYGLVDKVLA